MADRHTLHISKLENFKSWLIKKNWEIKPVSKHAYEVLRAKRAGCWVIVYKKDGAKEHLSLSNASIGVVESWLRECRIRKQVCDEIRDKAFSWQEDENGIIWEYHILSSELDKIEKGE